MRKYPTYKASGVEWLGEIPSGWNATLLKRSLNEIKDGTHGSFKRPEEGKPLLSAKNVQSDKIDISESESVISEEDYNSIIRNGYPKKNDLLLTIVGTIGRAYVYDLDYPLAFQRSVAFLRFKKDNNIRFYYYQVQSSLFLDQLFSLAKTSAQSGVYLSDIKGSIALIPPLSEQHSIVRFLDHKTGQIDRFIANRQRQIELLKEQVKKKIFTALTRGLSNKVFKPTNLPWFPEIPKDWDLYKFNAAIKLHHGFQFRDNHFREEGVKVVKITQLKADGTLDLSEVSFVEEKFLTILKDRIIKSGDILMALTGGTIGKIICVDDLQEEVLQNYRVGKFVPKDSKLLDKDFMFWVLSSDFTYAQILFLQRETGQPNIGISDFSKMFFPMPNTLEEQRKISAYIIEQKTETDTLISKYQKQIDLMQEYRTSLISQAVTGKIDVREWKPKARKYKTEEIPIALAAEN